MHEKLKDVYAYDHMLHAVQGHNTSASWPKILDINFSTNSTAAESDPLEHVITIEQVGCERRRYHRCA